MDKIDEVCGVLVEIRDIIEDLLDELIPPPVDERLESAMSEAPPTRGVAVSEGRPRARTTAKTLRQREASKTP